MIAQVLFCRLSPEQKSAYRDVLASPEIRMILEGRAQHFRAISMLRKICNHADLATIGGTSGSKSSLLTPFEEEDEEGGDEVGSRPTAIS